MNLERYTLSATKRLQEAQSLAASNANPMLESAHLLCAIVSAPDSINGELLSRLGIDVATFSNRASELVTKLPKVQ